MTDFESQETSYDLTKTSFPGVFFVFLNEPGHRRVLFFEAKNNSWFELENIFKQLRKNEYLEFQKDLQEYPQDKFIFKVLKSAPKYEDPVERRAALNQLRDEFFRRYPDCLEYQR